MDTSLSFAKITSPSIGTTVERSRLLADLDRASDRKLTWICGPGGCGKTTLIADYVQKKRARCLWYHVDRGDGDPATLFHFLRLAGLKTTRRSRKFFPPEFAPEFMPGLEVFARRFFRDLFAQLGPTCTVVFDNVQEAPVDSAFYHVLREGLSELPSGYHALLVSRSEPPPNFSGFLAKREMSLIDGEALRFTEAEVIELLQLFGQEARFQDQMQNVLSVTQGWAAGIILMTAVSDQVDLTSLKPDDGPVQNLFGYFATEVFLKADAAEQSFLIRSAFLPEMTVPLAQDIADNPNAEIILARLCRENFFTTRRSGRQPIYQYHPLFRAFLQNRAEALLSSGSLKALRAKAAMLLEAAGQVEAASELLIAMEDWPNLSRLIRVHAPKLMAEARLQTLAGWVGAVPDAVKDQAPDLLYWDGTTRIGFDCEQARSRLERSFALFQAQEDANGQYLALAAMVDAILTTWIDFRPFDRCIAEYEALRRRHPQPVSQQIEARILSKIVFAMLHRRICDPNLPELAERLVEIVQDPMDLALRASAGASLVACYCSWGEYGKAALILEAMRPHSKRDCPPQVWIMFHVAKMLFCWLTASFEECRHAEKEAVETIEDTGAKGMEILVLNQALSCALSENDRNRARAIISHISKALNSGPTAPQSQKSYPLRWMYHFYSAWCALLDRELPIAGEHATWSLNYADSMGELFALLSHIAIVNVAIEMDDPPTAESHLAKIAQIDREKTFIPLQVPKLIAEADVARRKGNRDKCLAALREAFANAKVHNLKNTEFWLADQMADLCVIALEADIEVDYVRSLARERELKPRSAPRHLDTWPWPLTVQTLGDFALTQKGERLSFKGKAQRKPLELLKALIAFGGRNVSIVRLQDALWPDAEGDAAERAFDITLHRLRKLLQVEDILMRSESRISLSAHLCWVDVWALNDLMEMATTAMGSLPSANESTVDFEALEVKILRLLQGAFLGNLSDVPWAVSARDRFSIRLMRFFHDLGRYWERHGNIERAAECYQRGLDVEAPSDVLRTRLARALGHITQNWIHISS